MNDELALEVQGLTAWLMEGALPLWARHGVDRSDGGFFEKLNFDLSPVEELRRARLVSRQIYCFSVGHALGWDGPAGELVDHGVSFLAERLIEDDGTVIMASTPDGATVKALYDPYDYAFVLFGLAMAAERGVDRARARDLACRVRDRLIADRAHPEVGFLEDLPLKSNPHMHLFEAFLAWEEVAGAEDPLWAAQADAIAELALSRLIDPETGALSEYFDMEWRALPDARGLVVEPGHQFEWSWLLARWAALRGRADAYAAARRLAEIGETYGVDAGRGVAINALDQDFKVRDAEAKLWPQTERLKAWHQLAVNPFSDEATRAAALAKLPAAIAGLRRYLVAEPTGLWREVMRADGSFIEEPVRASSLYHITCAIHTVSEIGQSPKES